MIRAETKTRGSYVYLTEPYAHQHEAFNKLYGREFAALLMEMGTGKTKVAIDIASNLFHQDKIDAVLLIAPKGVHAQWAREQLPLHSPVKYSVFVWGKKTKGALRDFRAMKRNEPLFHDQPLKWLCVNVDAFSTNTWLTEFKEYVSNHRTMVIVDESSRIKSPTANRTINITQGLATVVKEGRRVTGLIPDSAYRMILTGTVVTNSPYDVWAPFQFLKHDYFDQNYYAFRARYGIEVTDTNGYTGRKFQRSVSGSEIKSMRRYRERGYTLMQIAGVLSTTESNVRYILDHPELKAPYKNLDELKGRILPVSYIARKEECLDLPPKMYENIYVEMNEVQRRIYKRLREEYLAEYDNQELSVQNKIVLVGRLQQITGGFFPFEDEDGVKQITQITGKNPKIEALKIELEEAAGETVIIWARFRAEIEALMRELPQVFPLRRIESYYGGTDEHKRHAIIEDFQNAEIDILVANPAVGGIGLNLQHSRLHYYFSNSFSLEDRAQSEDRSHRAGQKLSVMYKDLIVKGTVDEKVHAVLQQKRNLLDYFRDTSLQEFLGEE